MGCWENFTSAESLVRNIFICLFCLSIIISLGGCEKEEIIASCGAYEALPECPEYTECFTTYYPGQSLTLSDPRDIGYNIAYKMEDGNNLVFHYSKVVIEEIELPQTDGLMICYFTPFIFDFLFQVPADPEAKSIYIGSSDFRKHKVFYFSVNEDYYNLLDRDIGCIYLEKVNENEWDVSVNITYLQIPIYGDQSAREYQTLQFTSTFQITSTLQMVQEL